jgi:Tol biopolymer transport system component
MDQAGGAEPLPGFNKPFVAGQVRYSPDGRQLAFVEQAPIGTLWLFDVERHTFRALRDRGIAGSPVWKPDGSGLVTCWSEAGPFQLWMVPTGRGDWERLTEGEIPHWAPSWSPDGQFLAFVRGQPPAADILFYRFEDRQLVPFLNTAASETHPEFSPDGRWLAYASNESGRYEVYLTSFPDRAQTFTVSRGGGRAPAWSRDGRRLFFYSVPSGPERKRSMMVVAVRYDPELSLGRTTPLFPLPDGFLDFSPIRSYEVHPDGRRFVIGKVVKQDPPPPVTRLQLVHNWFAELERLAPTGR